MLSKETLALLSVLAVVIYGTIYVSSILKGKTKPHLFTWLVWALLLAIGAAAQYADHAGIGSVTAAADAIMCLTIALLAIPFGEKHIACSDWWSFVAALSVIPIWYVTQEPLVASVLVTLIDFLGLYPTVRKSWHRPHEENLSPFVACTVIFALGLLALENYSVTTMLYPAASVLIDILFAIMLLRRRRILSNIIKPT